MMDRDLDRDPRTRVGETEPDEAEPSPLAELEDATANIRRIDHEVDLLRQQREKNCAVVVNASAMLRTRMEEADAAVNRTHQSDGPAKGGGL